METAEKKTRNRRPAPEGITPDILTAKLAEIINTASDFISRIDAGELSSFKDKNFGITYRRIEDIADDFDRVAENTLARAKNKTEAKERSPKSADPKSVARAAILAKQGLVKNLTRVVELMEKQKQDATLYREQINALGMEIEKIKQDNGITEVRGPGRPKKKND